MKIAVVNTITTPQMADAINTELRKNVGKEAAIVSFQDPSILSDALAAGYVPARAVAKLVSLYCRAISDGADVILNVCSTVGEAADSLQGMARFTGIPIVRIDEEMCREAVRLGKRVGLMATAASTLEPTGNTLRRVAREMNRRVDIVEALLDNMTGLSPEAYAARLVARAKELAPAVDVILLAQGSMAFCEAAAAEAARKTVLSSPRFGAEAVARALRAKGLL